MFNVQDEISFGIYACSPEDSSLEFSVGESLGSSCLDEVREAYQINGIYKSYLYMNHGSTFILFS